MLRLLNVSHGAFFGLKRKALKYRSENEYSLLRVFFGVSAPTGNRIALLSIVIRVARLFVQIIHMTSGTSMTR